ncbi:MAG: 4Fe-4S binding protein, partial [Chloroflexota bacterium]
AGDFRARIRAADGTTSPVDCGAVIIATGAGDYQPTEYLYGKDDRIITQKELKERLAKHALGQPSTVVMVQCVGSRDSGRPYCSRTCCTDAVLNAITIKEQSPRTQVFVLYRDVMTYGFREEYYTQAREAGVLFLRYQPDRKPAVAVRDGTLVVQVDSPIAGGKLEIETDLLVLSTGVVPGDNRELARILSLDLTEDGFFRELDTKFRPVDSAIDGIFICGPANSPRGTDEEITQGQAAAQRAATVLAKEQLRSGRLVAEVNLRRCSGCALCVANCPYGARAVDEERKVAVVKEVLCQGCGTCVAICPNGASKLRGLSEKQVFSMVEAALSG